MAKKVDFQAEFDKQRAVGVDIADPLNNLISKPAEQKPAPAERKPQRKKAAPKPKVDKLTDFVPERKSIRSRRVQLVIEPGLYERAKAVADKAGISFNELINQLCSRVTQ